MKTLILANIPGWAYLTVLGRVVRYIPELTTNTVVTLAKMRSRFSCISVQLNADGRFDMCHSTRAEDWSDDGYWSPKTIFNFDDNYTDFLNAVSAMYAEQKVSQLLKTMEYKNSYQARIDALVAGSPNRFLTNFSQPCFAAVVELSRYFPDKLEIRSAAWWEWNGKWNKSPDAFSLWAINVKDNNLPQWNGVFDEIAYYDFAQHRFVLKK